MIPKDIKPFFWDINTNTFEPKDYPDYTIFRILELGNENAISWLRSIFPEDEIKRVIRTERRLSKEKATYWAEVYDIPKNEVSAFSYVPAFPFP